MKEFKLIVAGGRDFNDYGLLDREITHIAQNGDLKDYQVSIVSGMARGADLMGCAFAQEHEINVYTFPADWNKHGKGAGFIRNEQMGKFADGLLAFWDGQSRGTKHMIDFMVSLNKPTWVVRY